MGQDIIDDPLAGLLRPLAWISAVAFLAGFALVIAIARPQLGSRPSPEPQAPAWAASHPQASPSDRRRI